MIKKEIYPKTQRTSCVGDKIYVTEKLDGSNLVIFKKNENIYIAQRKNIFSLEELEEAKSVMYKGLYQWLLDNKEILQDIYDDSAICGEWLGMGQIKYSIDEFDKRFYMFAKARVTDDFQLENIQYNHENFIYLFESQVIPKCIGIVPEVTELSVLPNKRYLDSLYDKYCNKVNHKVEGFILNYKDNITKNVRMKNVQLKEHFDSMKYEI